MSQLLETELEEESNILTKKNKELLNENERLKEELHNLQVFYVFFFYFFIFY